MKKIAKYAFDFAVKHGRKKVTAVHKANIMWVSKAVICRNPVTWYVDNAI